MGGGPAATAALAADAAHATPTPPPVPPVAAAALAALAAATTTATRLGAVPTLPPYSTEARLRMPRSTTPPETKPSSADVVARSDGAHCDRAGGSLAPEASTQIMWASDMRRRCEGGGEGGDGGDG